MFIPPRRYQVLRITIFAGGMFLSACAVPPVADISLPPATVATTPRLPEKKVEPPTAPALQLAPQILHRPEPLAIEQPVANPDHSTNIYFPLGSSEFGSDASSTIDRIAEQLKGNNQRRVRLFAFTDDLGSKAYCVALAAQRAIATTAELVKRGVRVGQIRRRIIGCETTARAPCVSDKCRRSRNRVEFRFDK
jgi:outer membrane protein OmpA-like peptidoglycan-associated protein